MRLCTPQLLTILFSLTGCTKQVYVEMPASPTIQLASSTVAVISADRACQDVANALAERLTKEAFYIVNPKARVQLIVSGCNTYVHPFVDIVQNVDAVTGIVEQSRRVRLDGRAHAQIEVRTDERAQAFLLGNAQWSLQTSRPKATHGMNTQLNTLLTDDLMEQVRPIPRIATRRVFPNAQPGTHKALLTHAVAAEVAGDLQEAIRLAVAANNNAPNPRIEAYILELRSRLQQLD